MADATWISLTVNATLNMTPSTFSFQDALSISGKNTLNPDLQAPFFFQNGCLQPDGSQNCTASCQDKNAVFGSLDTLHNCMVYPTVADLYARNKLSNTSMPEYYKIPKARVNSTTYNNITTTVQKCLMDLCNVTTGCTAGLKSWNEDNLMSSPSNLSSTFYIYSHEADGYNDVNSVFDFCDYIPGSFNPDIGGIGVYVSYWVQTGLALLAFVLVVWWNWAIYYICLGALLLPRGYSKASKAAQRIRNRSRNKHLPSLTGALAEFQKAQCFFMLAINIAALVNRDRGGFQPNNLQQLYNTFVLIKSISISGYLPITFTLFTLHLVDVVSWYLLVLSIVTVFVSLTTLFVVGSFSPSQRDLDYLSQQALTGGPDSCGLKNPAVYCYKPISGGDYDDAADPASGAYSILSFCLVVLILLIAHQSHAFMHPSTGKPKPWLSAIPNALFQESSLNIRKIQMVLALISVGLTGYALDWYLPNNGYFYGNETSSVSVSGAAGFALFTSCWTVVFALYLFLTSAAVHTRTDRPLGRYFSQKLAFTVDLLSAVFWFAGFISLARFREAAGSYGDGSDALLGVVTTSIIVGVCLCITFVVTTTLAARHMLLAHNERFGRHTLEKHYWVLHRFNIYRLQHWLSELVFWWRRLVERLPSWKQTSRRSPSWTKQPLIIDSCTKLQEDSLPTIKIRARRAYQDVKIHASIMGWPSILTSTAVLSMYLIFLGLYIHWFHIFILDLEWFAYNGVDSSSWSFGQIVAISVWAEPLCEYFHLELRGMTKGFEHRLWGYTVVKLEQLDAERGILSDSTSSLHHPSPLNPHEDKETGKYGKLGVVENSFEDPQDQDGNHVDQKQDEFSKLGGGDLATRSVSEYREGSDEADVRDSVEEWQIPETVILTSGSLGPL